VISWSPWKHARKRNRNIGRVRNISNLDYLLRHVSISVCNNSDSTRRNTGKLIFEYFSKICGKNEIYFEFRQAHRVFYKRRTCIYHSRCSVLLKIRNVSKKGFKNQRTHSLFKVFEKTGVFELIQMWKISRKETSSRGNVIRRMGHSSRFRIIKNTYSECCEWKVN
jgi:hypothetical protein